MQKKRKKKPKKKKANKAINNCGDRKFHQDERVVCLFGSLLNLWMVLLLFHHLFLHTTSFSLFLCLFLFYHSIYLYIRLQPKIKQINKKKLWFVQRAMTVFFPRVCRWLCFSRFFFGINWEKIYFLGFCCCEMKWWKKISIKKKKEKKKRKHFVTLNVYNII